MFSWKNNNFLKPHGIANFPINYLRNKCNVSIDRKQFYYLLFLKN